MQQQTRSIARLYGLTQAEVEARRQEFGANVLTPPERTPGWKLFLEKFEDPVIRILTIAAIVSIAIGFFNDSYLEGIGIITAIFLATTVSFVNEYQANREFDILNQVSDETPIQVIREGEYLTVPQKDLVVGDLVLLEKGDEVPADGEAIEAVSLQVAEANLTGEPPVRKFDRRTAASRTDEGRTYPADQLLRGTIVMEGHGTIEVTAVGDRTEIGQTARAAAQETDEETPLTLQLQRLSRAIAVAGLSVALLVDVALLVRGVAIAELSLTGQQWYVVGVLTLAVAIALVRIWLPIAYDGFEFAGWTDRRPEWLERDTAAEWLKTAAIALSCLAIGLGVGAIAGFLPESGTPWLPVAAARSLLTYFTIAVTIVVVAVPEGLALSVTLSLAYSMRKMTKQNNLVRRMHACETIGAATVICSDKTGTMTLNQMRVAHAELPDPNTPVGRRLVEGICANSTAHLHRHPGEASQPLGNPTEGALLLWLEERGIDYATERDVFATIQQWTFSTDRKYMATLGSSPSRECPILHVKGAPEILLDRCTRQIDSDGTTREIESAAIAAQLQRYQSRGMRTLGFAWLADPPLPSEASAREVAIDQLAESMTWVGFVAIADPIREDVPAAIAACQQAQIAVKMVTGDNPTTAKEIARQIGLVDDTDPPESYLTGPEFSQLDDAAAQTAAVQLKVLSRARPGDKQRLVKMLQAGDRVVAVTGDGTNDAPALNQAQVGLAMGRTSTSVAKEASDIIILDRAFLTIERAIVWGRSLYQNIQKFILFQLTINVAACGIALLGPFIGIELPLTVTQLLWVNLIMDTFAALALATEPPNEKVMESPPRNPQDFIISKPMAVNIFTTAFFFLTFLTGFLLFIQTDGAIADYDLSLFFSTFVMLQFWNLFNAKCFGINESVFSHLWSNLNFLAIAAIVFVGQVLMVQFGGEVFRTVPLSLRDWLAIVGGTSLVLWVGELTRAIARFRLRV